MNCRSPMRHLYDLAMRLYPRDFRREYERDMESFMDQWSASAVGRPARARLWLAAWTDLGRSLAREWLDRLGVVAAGRAAVRRARTRGWSSSSKSIVDHPPYLAAVIATVGVLTLNLATLAPSVAFWDAGEYLTTSHILGIPHPPGSALFVVLARSLEVLLVPLGLTPATRINAFSATCAAVAHGFWFLVVARTIASWAGDRRMALIAASVAVTVSATTFTVWYQSNVAEKVYTLSLLTTAMVVWLLLRWRDSGQPPRQLLAVVFVIALSAASHPMGLLVGPAAAAFVIWHARTRLLAPRLLLAAVGVVMIASSANLFLPLRQAQNPVVAEGEPRCEAVTEALAAIWSRGAVGCESLSAVLAREQYAKPPITVDPNRPDQPRGRELIVAQVANYFQYFNWQWARGIDGGDPLVGAGRLPFTLLFLGLGIAGLLVQRKGDRTASWMVGLLFVVLSIGLVVYLNFRFGYTIAVDRYPEPRMHEVRERDYFFVIGFSIWGLWAGIGIVAAWRRLAGSVAGAARHPLALASPVLVLALLPMVLNWGWASRADDQTARDWAYNLLMSVQPYGVIFTNGDNDSFPLWYLQEVEGIRQDVTVVVSPYLATDWYVDQLRALTEPCAPGVDPAASATVVVCQRPFDTATLPAPLAELGWTAGVAPPSDSIIPWNREEIEQVARSYSVTTEALTFRAGDIETRIRANTYLTPIDLVSAAVIQTVIDQRPIYMMPGVNISESLGLADRTIRTGLVWRLHDGNALPPETATFRHTADAIAPNAGAAIDLATTDTLFWEVYRRTGRVRDLDKPWVDHATISIAYQHLTAHLAAADAYLGSGDDQRSRRHELRMRWWEQRIAS